MAHNAAKSADKPHARRLQRIHTISHHNASSLMPCACVRRRYSSGGLDENIDGGRRQHHLAQLGFFTHSAALLLRRLRRLPYHG